MAHEIRIAIRASQFEVPVLGCQPCVKYLDDVDASVSKDQRAWRLLAAMAGVAFDTNSEGRLMHLIIAAPMIRPPQMTNDPMFYPSPLREARITVPHTAWFRLTRRPAIWHNNYAI